MKVTLKALRVNANMNQKEVACKLGVAPATLISWEAHKTYPSVLQLNQLCSLYSCTMDDIFLPDRLAKSEQKGDEECTN